MRRMKKRMLNRPGLDVNTSRRYTVWRIRLILTFSRNFSKTPMRIYQFFCPFHDLASNKFLQHLAQPRNSFADVFLVRAAEADAHFVVRLGARRIVGVAELAGNVEHVVL